MRIRFALLAACLSVVFPVFARSLRAEVDFVKGPYLGATGAREATVCWEWARPGAGFVEYRALSDEDLAAGLLIPRGPEQRAKFLAKATRSAVALLPARFHRVRLSNLRPGRWYRYRVLPGSPGEYNRLRERVRRRQRLSKNAKAAPDSPNAKTTAPADDERELRELEADASPWLLTRAAPRAADAFSFVVYGGSAGAAREHRALARTTAADRGVRLALHTGRLVSPAADRHGWNRDVFGPAYAMLTRVPLVPCFTGQGGARSPWERFFPRPPASRSLGGNSFTFRFGSAQFFVMDWGVAPGASTVTPARVQRLREALRADRPAWRVMITSAPPYSSGAVGSVLAVRRALREAGADRVDVVFSGGDRHFERTWIRRQGTLYVVSGTIEDAEKQMPRRHFLNEDSDAFAARGHFVRVRVDGRDMRIEAVDLAGKVFDRVDLRSFGAGTDGDPRVWTPEELQRENNAPKKTATPVVAPDVAPETRTDAGAKPPAADMGNLLSRAAAHVSPDARAVGFTRDPKTGKTSVRVARGLLVWRVGFDADGKIRGATRAGVLPQPLPAGIRALDAALKECAVRRPGARVLSAELVTEGGALRYAVDVETGGEVRREVFGATK